MKLIKILCSVGLFVLLLSACTANDKTYPVKQSVIPAPESVTERPGMFLFDEGTTWGVESTEQVDVAMQLARLFEKSAGFLPLVQVGDNNASISFHSDTTLQSEAYKLDITPEKIRIEASDLKGFFYATQTLRQLLPAEIESQERMKGVTWCVPALTISDKPRFEYRGLMLDACRFFIPKVTVLKIIDCVAMLKVNKLHFHLSDDNGWRLEIKKYPQLTEVGAWRVKRDALFPARRNAQPGEPATEGGFYTQDDMREIIAYALERQIEVIPEIEMPAHSNAALAAFPELACPVVDKHIGVLPGGGGANSSIIFCAGNDSTFTMLEGVIDEVAELFPSEYIHLGGDEALKDYWKKCPLCQKRMRDHNLKCEEDLQGYFMTRMSRYVQSKGKKSMGWDELTNSKLPEDIVIYGWQGYGNVALKAARQGHRFVMTPARVMYLTRYQGPQWFEPVTYFGNNTLKNVYDYEPVQADWEPEIKPLLMGVQASMWTEFCTSSEDVEYLIFPRLMALSEVAWSGADCRDWGSFLKRLDILLPRLDMLDITYARSMFNLDHGIMPANDSLKVSLSCIRPDVEIRYTNDGSEPQVSSPLYIDTLTVAGSQTIRAASFMNGERKGEILDLALNDNKAMGKVVASDNNKAFLLTNGLRGSIKYSDFEWVGWYDEDASFVVDLLESKPITKVTLGCITNYGMGVHMPSVITLSVSHNGRDFRAIKEIRKTPEQIFVEHTNIEDQVFDSVGEQARYIRVSMKNPGKCPLDHVRPGQGTWMYFDEIRID